jgi:endonuclease/exonuclease/phosphatase family metal-dependent hydrolase
MKILNLKTLTFFFILLFSSLLFSGCSINEITGQVIKSNLDYKKAGQINCDENLKIASFNIQTLGKKKVSNNKTLHIIQDIIKEFDLVAIQEIRDITNTTITTLSQGLPEYDYMLSQRLGRSSSKEQYALFYKKGLVLNETIFPDKDDIFEREPAIIYIQIEDKNYSIINIHVKPTDAENEISNLKQVIVYTQNLFKDKDFILLGDLNADCSYYNEYLDILKEYYWAIPNDMDTTVAYSSCTYDRIITNMNYCNSGVYNFNLVYNLDQDETRKISDHYPVWIGLP